MKKICFFILFLFACGAGASNTLWAFECTPSINKQAGVTYYASSQWVSGLVQTTKVGDTYRYITVNDIQYRLMPKVRIDRRVQRGTGGYNEISAAFQNIRKGQSVMLLAQGFRVYQILIME